MRRIYRDISDIRPVVEENFKSEDVSTEGGMLRYQNEDFRIQIESAHHEIDMLCMQLGLEVPRQNHQKLNFTPAGRLSILRDLIRTGESPYLETK
jgi:hypothetical protein